MAPLRKSKVTTGHDQQTPEKHALPREYFFSSSQQKLPMGRAVKPLCEHVSEETHKLNCTKFGISKLTSLLL